MSDRLKYVSAATVDLLESRISEHRVRYSADGFSDLAMDNGWAIEAATVGMDASAFGDLIEGSTSPKTEIANSLTVFNALPGMTPSIAREERVWVRLTHIEGLAYARSRWLQGGQGEALDKLVRDHFFGSALTSIRDDNAIGRLWWNARIAQIASPGDVEGGLKMILKTSDIRLNFVERTRTVSRPALAQGMLRIMRQEPWITDAADNFRQFMKVMNRNGGGLLFEVQTSAEIDKFLAGAAALAMRQSPGSHATAA